MRIATESKDVGLTSLRELGVERRFTSISTRLRLESPADASPVCGTEAESFKAMSGASGLSCNRLGEES